MVIQRAQKATKITALGFKDLNFENFFKVLYLHLKLNVYYIARIGILFQMEGIGDYFATNFN